MANYLIGKKIGICFSKELEGQNPLSHIGGKLPVYLRLLELLQKEGFIVYVLTRKTYQGKGIFEGGWLFEKGEFRLTEEIIKIDLVYDRTAGLKFPLAADQQMLVVNHLDFKTLCWDKWSAFQKIGTDMPQTFWLENRENLAPILTKIKTDWVVLKPFNGLKGLGIFIGPKKEALTFEFPLKFKKYIVQEFIDSSGGIPQIVSGIHDLRVAIVNQKPVWCHVRIPPQGSFKANAAAGGVLKEIDYNLIPNSIKEIVKKIAKDFYQEFDNPIFSLDFGLDKNGHPWLYEINDQIGFPRWEMKKRDLFLKELVKNFKTKLELQDGKNKS
jgi:glutathione synthase/RimK-type ligase-like ATP-grasp enzyme